MFEELVGQTVRDLSLKDDGTTLIIKTDKYKYTFVAEGDCCAVAYVLPVEEDDLKAFLGNKVVQANVGEYKSEVLDYGQTDTEFYHLRTHGGDITLELRTEHNGYYSGWLMMIGREEVWPVFDDIREEALKK